MSKDKEINIIINTDDSGAKKAATAVKTLVNELEQAESSTEKLDTSTEGLNSSFYKINSTITTLTNKLEGLNNQQKQTDTSTEKLDTSTEGLGINLYKINSITSSLNTSLNKYETELNQASLDTNKLKSETVQIEAALAKKDSIIKRVTSSLTAMISRLRESSNNIKTVGNDSQKAATDVDKLRSTITQLAGVVGITTLVDKFKSLTKEVLNSASSYEQAQVALTTMLGSAETANKLLSDLEQYAKLTPFDLNGLIATTKQLSAFGVETQNLLPVLDMLSNVSAGLNVPIDRIALAFGQVQAKTRLTGDELRQFTEAGIPMIAELSKQFGVSEQAILKMVSAGQIGFNDVVKAFQNMTSEGGKFYNMNIEQSKTVGGMISNLGDAFDSLTRTVGGAFASLSKDTINKLNQELISMRQYVLNNLDSFSGLAVIIANVTIAAVNFAKGLVIIASAVGSAVNAINGFFNSLLGINSGMSSFIGLTIEAGFKLIAFLGILKLLVGFSPFGALLFGITAVITALGSMKDNFDTIQQVLVAWYNTIKAIVTEAVIFIYNSFAKLANSLSDLGSMLGLDKMQTDFKNLAKSHEQMVNDLIAQQNKYVDAVLVANEKLEADQIKKADEEKKRKADEVAFKAQQEQFAADNKKLQTDLVSQYQITKNKQTNLELASDDTKAKTEALQREIKLAGEKIAANSEFVAKKKTLDADYLAGRINSDTYEQQSFKNNLQIKLESLKAYYNQLLQDETANQQQLLLIKQMMDEGDALLYGAKTERELRFKEFLLGSETSYLENRKVLRQTDLAAQVEEETVYLTNKLMQEQFYKDQKDALDQQYLNNKITRNAYEAQIDALRNKARTEALTKQYATEEKLATDDATKAVLLKKNLEESKRKEREATTQLELLLNSKEIQDANKAASTLVALQNSKHKEIAAVGKAAALYQITIDTASGAIGAYRAMASIPFVGPALGAAAAAAVVAYGLERASNVKSASFAVGTDNVPNDMMAQVHKGEIIVPSTFSEAIRSGDLTLGAGNLSNNTSNTSNSLTNSPTINIMIDNPQFIGNFDDTMIYNIGNRIGEMVNENLLASIPFNKA